MGPLPSLGELLNHSRVDRSLSLREADETGVPHRFNIPVAVSMYTLSIPVFIQHLNGLNTVLNKGAAWAAAQS
jgi:hypothetical protein